MGLFEHPEFGGHEYVGHFHDQPTGLHAIIAVHRFRSGVAGGGIRFFPYTDSQSALCDVLRLSKGMTYKSVLAGLPFGGGKSVIIGDPKSLKSDDLLEAFGRCVQRLNGSYICAEDIGITPDDMLVISRSTSFVAGLPGKGGDTSPLTGYGVYRALCAAAHRKLGRPLASVAILGFGNVGRNLAKHLVKDDVRLFVADIDKGNVTVAIEEYGAVAVNMEQFFSLQVDAIAPCSIGAVLNDQTVPQIRAPIVCGGANNQLANPKEHDCMLSSQGVLFVPDYIANSGGLISGSAEVVGRFEGETMQMVEGIYETCLRIFEMADAMTCSPLQAAERAAMQILQSEAARWVPFSDNRLSV